MNRLLTNTCLLMMVLCTQPLILAGCAAPALLLTPQGQLMWSLLKPMVGLDPKEVNFFKQPLIQTRLQPLLGTHYDKAVQLLETADKIQQEGPLFYLVSTYTPVPELAEKAGFVWNSETNQMAVMMISGGAPQIFAEKLNEQLAAQVPVWPKELADYTDPAKLKHKALERAKAEAVAQLPVPTSMQPIAEATLRGQSLEQQSKVLLKAGKQQAVQQVVQPLEQTKQQLQQQISAPIEQAQQQLQQQVSTPIEQAQQQLQQQISAPIEQAQQQLQQQISAPIAQAQQQLQQQVSAPIAQAQQQLQQQVSAPIEQAQQQLQQISVQQSPQPLVSDVAQESASSDTEPAQQATPALTVDDEFVAEQRLLKQQQRDRLHNELQTIELQLQQAVTVDEHFTLSQRKSKLQQQLQALEQP